MIARSPTPLLLTQGDPAGIGPEIALRAWLGRDEAALPPFAVISDSVFLRRLATRLGWNVPVVDAQLQDVPSLFPHSLPVIALDARVDAEPGTPDPRHAEGTIESIARAVDLVQGGHASALVTNPIAKHVLQSAGFRYPGHTEYLAALATPAGTQPLHPVMMLWCPALAVVPVTVHVPLSAVAPSLTADLICRTARIVAHDLATRFGIAAPRLAVAGLNPHAGENGTMGFEDRDVIAPALAALRSEGMVIEGPFAADTMFHARARRRYDAALAMYHDQALIPIKTLAFDEAVNVTLGLPFVRTSPDHGTAFDIAGRGIARPDSLQAAIRLAARLAARNGK